MPNMLNYRSPQLTLLHHHPTLIWFWSVYWRLYRSGKNTKWSKEFYDDKKRPRTLKTRSPQVPGCDTRWANKLSPGRPCISIEKPLSLYLYFIDSRSAAESEDGTKRRQSGATFSPHANDPRRFLRTDNLAIALIYNSHCSKSRWFERVRVRLW